MMHGFGAGRGMGTSALNSKLLKHITAMRGAVLYDVFLDLQMAYDALDRYRCLKIIVTYGLGPRYIWLLQM